MSDDTQIPRAQAGDTVKVRRLCLGIRRGDEQSLETLYRAWHTRAIALARHWSGMDTMMCEDAAHELFLRVIRALPELDDSAALDAWMTTTLRRIVLDTLRRRVRAAARIRRVASDSSPSPVPLYEYDILASRVATLEEHEREALRLRMGSDGTLAQLAAALHISPDQLHGRIRRAISKLKTLIEVHHD